MKRNRIHALALLTLPILLGACGSDSGVAALPPTDTALASSVLTGTTVLNYTPVPADVQLQMQANQARLVEAGATALGQTGLQRVRTVYIDLSQTSAEQLNSDPQIARWRQQGTSIVLDNVDKNEALAQEWLGVSFGHARMLILRNEGESTFVTPLERTQTLSFSRDAQIAMANLDSVDPPIVASLDKAVTDTASTLSAQTLQAQGNGDREWVQGPFAHHDQTGAAAPWRNVTWTGGWDYCEGGVSKCTRTYTRGGGTSVTYTVSLGGELNGALGKAANVIGLAFNSSWSRAQTTYSNWSDAFTVSWQHGHKIRPVLFNLVEWHGGYYTGRAGTRVIAPRVSVLVKIISYTSRASGLTWGGVQPISTNNQTYEVQRIR